MILFQCHLFNVIHMFLNVFAVHVKSLCLLSSFLICLLDNVLALHCKWCLCFCSVPNVMSSLNQGLLQHILCPIYCLQAAAVILSSDTDREKNKISSCILIMFTVLIDIQCLTTSAYNTGAQSSPWITHFFVES